MKRRIIMIVLAACALIASASVAAPTSNELPTSQWVKQAETQLAAGEFAEALTSYAGAVKSDPENEELKQQYTMLRQVIRVQKMHASEQDVARKQQMAAALRSYFYDNSLFNEAVKLDKVTYTDAPSTASAANLAESHLELNEHAAATELLSTLPKEKQTNRTRTLLAIAMLREGNIEDGSALAAKLEKPADDDAGLYFEQACVYCLVGNVDQASSMLAHSFKMTRPSLMDKAHARAMKRADLKSLNGTEGMKLALATKSEVKESSCSGQSSCAGCPSASSCGSSDDDKEETSGCDSHDK